jgi:MAF protein
MEHPPILLASSSPYRQALLAKLGIAFITASPDIDESSTTGESARALALRLAREKAEALASSHPGLWIIGSDQVASLATGEHLSKPGSHAKAVDQLSRSSGQTVTFFTGLVMLNADTGEHQAHCELFKAHFRELSPGEIEHYLKIEKPYDCAGSFKMEGLGIALFRALEGEDPNSLVGLPMIALSDMLRNWGLNPLLAANEIN